MSEMHSVVVPMFCEEAVADRFLTRLVGVLGQYRCWEVIVVDDGSTDATFSILQRWADREPRIKLIRFARNFGHQIAITAGIDRSRGDTVTVIDADLQDPPEVIPQLIEEWRSGADIVYAVRTARAGESAAKRATAHLFYRLLQRISKETAPLDSGDFRLMSRSACDAFRAMKERNRYVRGMVGWIGMRESRVTYSRDARAAGATKYTLSKMVRLAVDGILSSSVVPLRMANFLGVICALLGFVVGIWAFVLRVSGGTVVRGWTSTVVIVLVLGGVQLLTLGVIGEYVGRTYDEVRQRPLYLIHETVGWSEATDDEPRRSQLRIRYAPVLSGEVSPAVIDDVPVTAGASRDVVEGHRQDQRALRAHVISGLSATSTLVAPCTAQSRDTKQG